MHGHHHDHPGHSHAPADFGRAFAIGILLNVGFVAIEAFYGLMSGSMALLADAGHNLSDVLSLVVAWAGVELAKRMPSRRFTYRSEERRVGKECVSTGRVWCATSIEK